MPPTTIPPAPLKFRAFSSGLYFPGADFAAAVRAYVVKPLRKGVPSLFTDLKGLYADPAKATEMGKAFAEIEKSLADSGKFPGAADKEAKPAEVRVYALNLLAYHKDKAGGLLRTSSRTGIRARLTLKQTRGHVSWWPNDI